MIQLTNEKLTGYSIRITEKPYDSEELAPLVNELNLSPDASSMKIIKYNRVNKQSKVVIHTNTDFVRFYHAESECFLSASCNSAKTDHLPYLRKIKDAFPTADENMSIKSIFTFEYNTKKSSQAVEWGASVKIRHLATNKYVCVNPKPNKGVYQTTLTSKENDPSSNFNLIATDVQGKHLPSTQVSMRLEHTFVDKKHGSKTVHMSSSCKPKWTNKAKIEQKSFDIVFLSHRGDNDAFVLMPLPKTVPFSDKISSVLSLIPTAKWFAARMASQNLIRRTDIAKMETLLSKLVYLSDHFYNKDDYEERVGR